MNPQLNTIENSKLHYINENDLFFLRKKRGKGFVYINPEGKQVRNKKHLQRFESLVIPPAWYDVMISEKEMGHIQVTGRDIRGRKQYIYHSLWDELRNENKYNRIIEFGESLPLIRKHIEKDLKKKSLLRDKVLAVIIKLLEETLIRVGNEIYVEQNKSYGLTTLKNRHIEIKGITLNFQFNGKGGKPFQLTHTDKTLAGIIKKCQELPGQHLFQYIDEENKSHPVESSDVNNYLNKIVEKNFTAKDFRTWAATVIASSELNRLPISDNEKENERNIVKAVKHTAKRLNNTPATCRKYYIHPYIFDAYLNGDLFKVMKKASLIKRKNKHSLALEEKGILLMLKKFSRKKK